VVVVACVCAVRLREKAGVHQHYRPETTVTKLCSRCRRARPPRRLACAPRGLSPAQRVRPERRAARGAQGRSTTPEISASSEAPSALAERARRLALPSRVSLPTGRGAGSSARAPSAAAAAAVRAVAARCRERCTRSVRCADVVGHHLKDVVEDRFRMKSGKQVGSAAIPSARSQLDWHPPPPRRQGHEPSILRRAFTHFCTGETCNE
jgi:hypothetical protein